MLITQLQVHWIWFAVLSAFLAGITGVLAKVGLKKMDSTLATALRTIIILGFCWMFVCSKGAQGQIYAIDQRTWIFLILSGLATGGSWLCYFKALQVANVNKVAPIDKLSTVLTMLLALVILGESLTRNKIISMILITVGILLMTIHSRSEGRKGQSGWWIYAVLSAVFASLTAILGKIGMEHVDSDLGTAIRTAVVLVMAWIMVFVTKHSKELKSVTLYHTVFILLSGITTGLSWICYYRALQLGEASVVVPIDKLSIVITILFSRLALKERLSNKALLGLIILVAGTILLVV